MQVCSVCKKNIAVVFISKVENGQTKMEGLCMECAKKMGIPVMDQMMKQFGMSSEDVKNMNEQMKTLFQDMKPEEIQEEMKNMIESMGLEDGMKNMLETMGLDDGDNNPLMNMFTGSFEGDSLEDDNEENLEELSIDNYDSTSIDDYDKVSSNDYNTSKNDVSKENNPFSFIGRNKDADKKMFRNNSKKNLNKYGIDLTKRAREGFVDDIIGRHREIDRVVQILNRRTKNNPILIGEPGVGKTAIAEGLAKRIVEKKVPEKLFNAEIYLLDLTSVVAGTQFRGQFESRMKAIIKEAKDCGNVILVIDEVHNIMGAGEVQGGAMNAANILKPALAKGEVQVIGATTLEEYRKHIEKDTALERRFQPVLVEEPTKEETIQILEGIVENYEEYHKVKISNEVIREAVNLSGRYITDRFFPDKAIDVIDEAGSRANLKNKGLVELSSLKEELSNIQKEKEFAEKNNDYEKAAQAKVEEFRLLDNIQLLEKEYKEPEITIEDIAYVIEAWTKIPVQKITEEEAQKLLNLEERLHKRIVGQDEAITSLSKAIRRNRSGFRKRKKPASFIFVGPTGVGKTELVKALAVEMFGTEEAMIRIDMSEYMEKHTVSKLIGAPPGYVGYDQGGQLTEKVRRKPYSVILLDEIEKAHPDVFNMLLQILEDGRLTDSQGRTVYFENTIIIMTSNAGSNLKSNGIGFAKVGYEALKDTVNEALRNTFIPEFLNRVDETIVFTRLSKQELKDIIELMLDEVVGEVKEKDMFINVSDGVKEFILEHGYDEKYGARPLRRTIQKYIEDEIAEQYLQNKFNEKTTINVELNEGKVIVETIAEN